MDGVKDLLTSKKALVTLLTILVLFALVAVGKIQWNDAKSLLMLVVPVYLAAQGVADASERFGALANDSRVEANQSMKERLLNALPPFLESFVVGFNATRPRLPNEKLNAFVASLSNDQLGKLAESGIFTPEQLVLFKDVLLDAIDTKAPAPPKSEPEKTATVTPDTTGAPALEGK